MPKGKSTDVFHLGDGREKAKDGRMGEKNRRVGVLEVGCCQMVQLADVFA